MLSPASLKRQQTFEPPEQPTAEDKVIFQVRLFHAKLLILKYFRVEQAKSKFYISKSNFVFIIFCFYDFQMCRRRSVVAIYVAKTIYL